MHSAIEKLSVIQDHLKKAGYLYLFLDFDGTLTPIVATPDQAVLSPEVKNLLQELAKAPQCKVAVISGRALDDIKAKVGLKNIVYVGNHGFEIDGGDLKFNSLITPRLRIIYEAVKKSINELSPKMPGILIEDKRATLSVHYRLLSEKNVPLFSKFIRETVKPYIEGKEITLNDGKKVYEIRPAAPWDKGEAVKWLLTKEEFSRGTKNILPIYIGDDTTDEDAFATIGRRGITVVVGKRGRSNAQYFLDTTDDVFHFLINILETMKVKPHDA